MNQTALIAAFGRLLIAVIFISSGISKIADPANTQAYIASHGLPVPMLAYIVAVVVELGGGLLLLVGFQTRIVALIVAVFTMAAAAGFHSDFSNQNMMIHFLKNVAITGGLLQVVAFGAGSFSLDARRTTRSPMPA